MGLEEWYFGYLKNAFIPRYLLTLYRVHRVYHISFYSHFVQNKQSFITKKYSLYVGRYIPPHFGEVNLTPEELEALRKKEERKDKLHQAYLRRKANGTQKRYEEKIKAKKKAEIEAKKAAIHAEDMENGVFIPASSLPKKEPQKAPMPARAAM